ncbi:MAG TPA: von Willebrand factor type A domain-containing protein [Opitutaceae bacterium]
MSRRREVWIAYVIGGIAAAGFAYLVARERQRPQTLSEVVMMAPFVSTPAAAEESVIESAAPATAQPAGVSVRAVGLSGRFAPVTGEPVGVALTTGRGSYRAFVQAVRAGQATPVDAIQLEEWIHAPRYDYTPPTRAGEELAVHLEVAVAPWNPTHRLVRVGLKATPDPAGGRVRQVRAGITFDPRFVRSARRLASGEATTTEGDGISAAVDFGPDATFTALYEVALTMVEGGELLGSLGVSREITGGRRVASTHEIHDGGSALLEASEDFRFAVALAGLGLWQRSAPEAALIDPDDLIRWIGRVDAYDVAGRMEFIALVTKLRTRR